MEPVPRVPEDRFPRSFGPYTLRRELGRGAMGVVYEAEDPKLERRIALKVLLSDASDAELVERFRREALACARIRHDHVVAIHDAGEAEGRSYYTMDLVPGRTLASLIRSGEVPPLEELLRGLAGVADALHTMHDAGLVHRDVKPSNVIVRPDGRMILADFGLARSASTASLTQSGQMVGTPLYMSPEQIVDAHGGVDARTDVYGLGATLYEALCGQPVFAADAIPALVGRILTQRPAPPRTLSRAVPKDVERIVLKALEKRREDRYESAAGLRDDLVSFVAGRPVLGRPVGRPTRLLRAAWRRRYAAALLLVALGAGAFAWGRRPATVAFETEPAGAAAWVDELAQGPTPLRLSLAPGSHHLVLRLEGYLDWSRTVETPAGSERTFDVQLVVADATDTKAINRIAAASGVQLPYYRYPQGQRATVAGSPVEVLFPQGDVRAEDLALLALDVDERVEPGSLQVRRGDEVLWSAPFDPQQTSFEVAMPDAVRAAARVGDTLTWGVWPERGTPVTATVRVVPPVATDRLAEIDRRFAEQPARVRRHLRAQLLLDQRLFTAAFLEARALRSEDETDLRASAVMESALAGMGASKTRVAASLRGGMRAVSGPALDRVFEDVPPR